MIDEIIFHTEVERLQYENDTLKAFIIDIYNASAPERLNIVFDAMDYIKQLNQSKWPTKNTSTK